MDPARSAELHGRFNRERTQTKFPGIQLTHLDHGFARVIYVVDAGWMIGGEGDDGSDTAHGGLAFSICDTAGVYAAMTMFPRGHALLVNFSGQPRLPLRLGDRVVAQGWVSHEDDKMIWVAVHAYVLGSTAKRTHEIVTYIYAKPSARS